MNTFNGLDTKVEVMYYQINVACRGVAIKI